MKIILFVPILFLLPFSAFAGVVINEIMYDLEGSDSGREWIEVFNNGSGEVDLSGWRFYEAEINHKINLFDENGDFIISANGYAVIADNPSNFLTDWPSFSGIVFDSSFSLKNTGENLVLRDSDLNDIDTVFYNPELGAGGDGNSLQKISGSWAASIPTPGEQNSPSTSSGQDSEEEQQESSSGGAGWPEYVPPEERPRITAYAGEDKVMVAGASAEFKGAAYGLENELLENARYLWNFGDGTFKEGKNIAHFYRYPGEYIVILDVSSGGYSSSGRILVKVIPNEVFISEVKTGTDSFVEFYNGSKEEINLSGWRLRSGSQSFTFSKNSFIQAGGYLVIPIFSSGVILSQGNSRVDLLYLNGGLADSLIYNGFLSENQSFSRKDDGSVITPQTPGAKNIEPFIVEVKETKPIQEPQIVQEPKIAQEPEIKEAPTLAEGEAGVPTSPKANVGKSQQAGVVSVRGNDPEKDKTILYLLTVFGLTAFAGLGLFLIRRQRSF